MDLITSSTIYRRNGRSKGYTHTSTTWARAELTAKFSAIFAPTTEETEEKGWTVSPAVSATGFTIMGKVVATALVTDKASIMATNIDATNGAGLVFYGTAALVASTDMSGETSDGEFIFTYLCIDWGDDASMGYIAAGAVGLLAASTFF